MTYWVYFAKFRFFVTPRSMFRMDFRSRHLNIIRFQTWLNTGKESDYARYGHGTSENSVNFVTYCLILVTQNLVSRIQPWPGMKSAFGAIIRNLHFISFLRKTSYSPKIVEFEKENSYLSITSLISVEISSDFSAVFGFFQAGSSRNKSLTPIVLRRWPECSPIPLTKKV